MMYYNICNSKTTLLFTVICTTNWWISLHLPVCKRKKNPVNFFNMCHLSYIQYTHLPLGLLLIQLALLFFPCHLLYFLSTEIVCKSESLFIVIIPNINIKFRGCFVSYTLYLSFILDIHIYLFDFIFKLYFLPFINHVFISYYSVYFFTDIENINNLYKR